MNIERYLVMAFGFWLIIGGIIVFWPAQEKDPFPPMPIETSVELEVVSPPVPSDGWCTPGMNITCPAILR